MTEVDANSSRRSPAPGAVDGTRAVLGLCVGLLGSALLLGWSAAGSGPEPQWAVALLLLGLYMAAEAYSVEIEFRNETHTFSFTSVPLVMGLLLMPVPLLAAIRVLSTLVVLGGIRRQAPLKLLVNSSSHALEVLVAGHLMLAFAGSDPMGPHSWLIVILAVMAADLAGAVIVTTAISLFQQSLDRSLFVGIWVPMIVTVADSSFALGVTSELKRGSLNALLSVPVALLVVALAHRLARVNNRYQGVIRLDRFARDLGTVAVVDSFETILLERVAEVMHADAAWIHRVDDDGFKLQLVGRAPPVRVGVSPFDQAVVELVESGPELFDARSPLGSGLAEADLNEAIVGRIELPGVSPVVLGVGDRSGAIRGFDREDVLLFATLCSHAAVSLRNVALIRELRTESANLEHQATHDPLTGLPNRSRFKRHVDQARSSGARFSVLLLDLDHFKEVNDTLGHASGDALLIEVGRRLAPGLEDGELLARLGGDEFALCIATDDERDVIERCHAIIRDIRTPYQAGAVEVGVEASIGIATFDQGRPEADDLLRRADVAMYVAKANHTGVEIYTPEIDHFSPQRLAVAARLRTAIDNGEISLHYQPQIDLVSGRPVAVEALARWSDPERGEVPPTDFIEVAERTDLIHPLTDHVLRTAIAQAGDWQRAGFPLRVAVNLSARNLTEPALAETIGRMLSRQGLEPGLLEVELTETTIMTNPTIAASVMARLRAMGVRIAIDDFGTGHSSLAYLTSLPVDLLKIDRSFILAMDCDPTAATIVKSVIDLGRNLNLGVVAEGVESLSTADALRVMRCGMAQGYVFSRPLPPAQLTEWLRARVHSAGSGAARQLIGP